LGYGFIAQSIGVSSTTFT